MTVLASSFSAAFLSAASAPARSEPSISMSKTLPCRTLEIPSTPSERKAPSMALPCGSRMPAFNVTVTRAFMMTAPPLQYGGIAAVAMVATLFAATAVQPGIFVWFPGPRGAPAAAATGPVASALDEDGTRALRPLAFAHDAEPFGDLGIRLQQPAEVAAETVLVELLVRFDVPQATGIWRNLVGDDDPHHVVLPQPTSLHLEIDQANANAEEQPGKKVVDADGQRHDVVDLLRRRPAERGNMLLRYHRIVELVILVIEFDDRARQLRAFLDAEPLRQRAGGDVTHHHFERNDLDFANELLAHVESADEMRRHADVVEVLEDVFRNPVVEHALAFDHLMLFGIEGGRIVLEVLDQSSWLGPFVEDLRLAFIDTATAAHRSIPWLGEIHWIGRGSRSIVEVRGSATGARLKRGPSATGKLAERDAEHNRHRPAPLPPQRSSCDRVTVALTRHARYARRQRFEQVPLTAWRRRS